VKQIIIGRTSSCLLYSWRTQTPVLIDKPLLFHPFDQDFVGLDFSEFNATLPKEMISNLCFALGITGLLLQPNNVERVRLEDNIKVFTKGSRMVEYDAEPLIFDGRPTGDFNVYDSFHWRRGQTHDLTEIVSHNRFARKIIFYPSRRKSVRPRTKDVMVISKMTENELLDPDYGNGMVRLKALREMKERGLKGNFSHEVNGKRYHKAIKLEFFERRAIPIYKQKHDFREVFEMEQIQEKPWITFEKLRSK
jgi:hypothetical protein